MPTPQYVHKFIHFLRSMAIGVVLASVIQTQLNLWSLQQFGMEIDLATRLTTSAQDLLSVTPLLCALFTASLLIAWAASWWLLKLFTWINTSCLYALTSALSVWALIVLLNYLAAVPNLIAATRSNLGLFGLLGAAALSGGLWGKRTITHSTNLQLPSSGLKQVLMALLAVSLCTSVNLSMAANSAPYRVETVASGLVHPWSLAFLPDGNALITERPGRLRLWFAKEQRLSAPIPGLPKIFSGGQAGLFSVIASPHFNHDRTLFFTYASGTTNANRLTVAKTVFKGDKLEHVTEIFRCWPDKQGKAHYGGRMTWLPDNTLLISLGEGYSYREQAQNRGNHLGTTVRIQADGSVPTDNPFIGQKGAQPEIYTYGHRNVQGLIYDPVDRLVIAHEHGPKGGDEINIIEPGKNYGWPAITYGIDYSGAIISPFTERPGMEQPVLQWTPSIAPSGLTRYRGNLFPQWRGNLFIGALAGRSVHRVVLQGDTARDVETLFSELNERIRDVVSGPDGALYLLTDNKKGRLLKVTPR